MPEHMVDALEQPFGHPLVSLVHPFGHLVQLHAYPVVLLLYSVDGHDAPWYGQSPGQVASVSLLSHTRSLSQVPGPTVPQSLGHAAAVSLLSHTPSLSQELGGGPQSMEHVALVSFASHFLSPQYVVVSHLLPNG